MSRKQDEVVRLLMENRSILFAYIYAAVQDINTAEELLQETSVAICEYADRYTSGSCFGAWSREIARRRVLAHFRQSKRESRLLSEDNLHNLERAFSLVEARTREPGERLHALRQCLETLTPRLRRWLHLRYVVCLPITEIADQAQRHPESVRKSLYRSRRLLRDCIERRLQWEQRA